MSTYLVTGACGFIGANYTRLLAELDPGSTVVAVDYLGFAANQANLDGLDVPLEVVDIADYDAVAGLYERHRPDVVVNFAAESHNDRAIVSSDQFVRSNVVGVHALLAATRRHPATKLVHVSTIEVYGELPPGQEAFTEGSALNAKTPYSAAKAAGDQLVRAFMHTYPDLDLAMTHCANNYGPFQLPEKLIPLAITNVLRGRKVPIYGDGLQRRDWLHVVDHCRAIQAVVDRPPAPIPEEAATRPELLPIYDISARHEVTNLEIVERILAALGEGEVEHVPDRPNHDRRYLIDPAKIETELGWKPTVEFDEGLEATVRWYVDNRKWWEDVLAAKGDLQFDWSREPAAGP